jgi:hypothetical protein
LVDQVGDREHGDQNFQVATKFSIVGLMVAFDQTINFFWVDTKSFWVDQRNLVVDYGNQKWAIENFPSPTMATKS